MDDIDDVGLGRNVGKSAHRRHGLTPFGKKIISKQLPNSEPKLRAVFDTIAGNLGSVMMIVNEPVAVVAAPW